MSVTGFGVRKNLAALWGNAEEVCCIPHSAILSLSCSSQAAASFCGEDAQNNLPPPPPPPDDAVAHYDKACGLCMAGEVAAAVTVSSRTCLKSLISL